MTQLPSNPSESTKKHNPHLWANEPMAQAMPQAKANTELEREAHKLFEQWLRLNQVPFAHSRMDKPASIRKGWPDFTMLANSRGCCVEFKSGNEQLNDDQQVVVGELRYREVPVLVTTNVSEAIAFTKRELML